MLWILLIFLIIKKVRSVEKENICSPDSKERLHQAHQAVESDDRVQTNGSRKRSSLAKDHLPRFQVTFRFSLLRDQLFLQDLWYQQGRIHRQERVSLDDLFYSDQSTSHTNRLSGFEFYVRDLMFLASFKQYIFLFRCQTVNISFRDATRTRTENLISKSSKRWLQGSCKIGEKKSQHLERQKLVEKVLL